MEPFIYRGSNAIQKFVKRIDKELVQINEVLAINNDISDNKNNSEYLIVKQKFDISTECWICKKPLDNDKVWNHNYITSKYRDLAYNDCNIQLWIQPWKTPIPIVFHNFRGYNSYLVCELVGQSVNAHQITVIAETLSDIKW